ncbi:MAG: biopolymer transporter ExbD [Bacteroidota bacterium]
MSKFKKNRGKSDPAISTASLPDIIFMLLFFFMVVTVLREDELLVRVRIPSATELTKIEDKSLVNNIHIGQPTVQNQRIYGTSPRIQLNDKIIENSSLGSEIAKFLAEKRSVLTESERSRMTNALKVDEQATVGIIEDVKVELRKNNSYRLMYSTNLRTGKLE